MLLEVRLVVTLWEVVTRRKQGGLLGAGNITDWDADYTCVPFVKKHGLVCTLYFNKNASAWITNSD